MYEIKPRGVRSQIPYTDTDLFYFSCIIFKKYYGFIKKSNSSEKNVIVEEELYWIDMDET